MKNIEEYLYFHENQDYASLKFLSCTYYQTKQRLVVRYIYQAEIETQLPMLKKRLEELFIRQVGLPIKYDFIYKKVYVDNLTLQLEIASFLRQKFGILGSKTKNDDVVVKMDNNTWQVNLHLPKNLIDFLNNSQQWRKFQQSLQDKNFNEIDFHLNAVA